MAMTQQEQERILNKFSELQKEIANIKENIIKIGESVTKEREFNNKSHKYVLSKLSNILNMDINDLIQEINSQ